MLSFIMGHWEWLTGFIVSLIGALISWRAYKYSKQANKDTNELIKHALREVVNTPNKEEIKNRLIEAAISEWRLRGEAKTFLTQEFKILKEKGWTEKEFEDIYERVSIRHKNRKPKHALFD